MAYELEDVIRRVNRFEDEAGSISQHAVADLFEMQADPVIARILAIPTSGLVGAATRFVVSESSHDGTCGDRSGRNPRPGTK